MFYLVAGCTLLIEAHDAWSSRAVAEIFSGWFLRPLSAGEASRPDVTLRIRCSLTPPQIPSALTEFAITSGGNCFTDNNTYYLKFGDSVVIFGPGSGREVDLWVDRAYELPSTKVIQLLSHALSPALRRCGIFEIHSAGVIPRSHDKAIMIAGPSGSGKSTLTSQLARCGWAYISDDILLLKDTGQSIQAQGFRRFFALTADTIAAVKLATVASDEGNPVWKKRLAPEEHFEAYHVQQASLGAIVFPTLTRTTDTRVVRLSSAETMRRLLRLCPWASYDKPTSGDHLRMLGLLANSTTAFDLFAGTDLLDDANLAAKVFCSFVGENVMSG